MFMTKKRRLYEAYVLISDYVRPTTTDLASRLYLPDDEPGTVCSCAAILVYIGILLGGSNAHIPLFMANFGDQPSVQDTLTNTINELLDDAESSAGKGYYKIIPRPDSVSRIVSDPYNAILDQQYGRLAYAMQCYADRWFAEYRPSLDPDRIGEFIYRYFVSQEYTAKPLVEKLRRLLT